MSALEYVIVICEDTYVLEQNIRSFVTLEVLIFGEIIGHKVRTFISYYKWYHDTI